MRKTIMLFLFVCLCVFMYFPANLYGGVVFWNKMGSMSELQNSGVGPGFDYINGIKEFGPVRHGDGVEVNYGGGCGVHLLNPIEMGPMIAGTIEFWYLSNTEEPDREAMYLASIFTQDSSQCVGVSLYWDAGYGDNYGLVMSRCYGGCQSIQTGTPGDANITFSTTEPTHLAFVWDWNGIKGTADTMRVYRDGEILLSGQVSGWANSQTAYCVRGPGDFRPTWATAPNGKIDNLIIWDCAKTDFSGRFRESPICKGDFDDDGDVDGSDLAVFASDFGRTDCHPCTNGNSVASEIHSLKIEIQRLKAELAAKEPSGSPILNNY